MQLKEENRKLEFKEYVEGEELAEIKHEFVEGDIYAMTGASHKHNLLISALFLSLGNHLKKRGCTPLVSDQMVSNRERSFGFYPDIVVYCGTPEFSDENGRVLLNPTIIIEVLSPSTEDTDRGRKAYRYREIESLKHYIIVWQDLARIENHWKDEKGNWTIEEIRGIKGTLAISSIDFSIAFVEFYEGVL